jgi:hypothetical protein
MSFPSCEMVLPYYAWQTFIIRNVDGGMLWYDPMIKNHGTFISSHFIFRAIKNNEYFPLFDEYPAIQL